jgi:hypothetical protein
MKRTYDSGELESVEFFVGREVERTPAYGMLTLFVTGLQSVDEIENLYNKHNCEHIFFGANHSFKPEEPGEATFDSWTEWEAMIEYFLKKNYLCSLDINISYASRDFLDTVLTEYNNFIPQIRVPIPYIKLWNYNTMIKFDDKDFQASNPGVWCHSLHDLMSRDKFTDWREYANDIPLESEDKD